MDLTSPKIIKELLAKYEARPSKGLGQNFLIDKNVLEKIIKTAEINPVRNSSHSVISNGVKPGDTILEVGPGIGTLTQELAKHANKVIAVEKDSTMVEILKETLKDYNNVEIIQADILHYQLPTTNYKLVANIPYYITAPLIRSLLESKNQPKEMVLMLQKEVAQRICSDPPNMTLLSVSVQFYADAKIISYVSKNCFWPSPKVDSAIIKITPFKKRNVSAEAFFKVVKAGFSQPRKQLIGNLSKALKLDKEKVSKVLLENGIEPKTRAETLSIEDWVRLAGCV